MKLTFVSELRMSVMVETSDSMRDIAPLTDIRLLIGEREHLFRPNRNRGCNGGRRFLNRPFVFPGGDTVKQLNFACFQAVQKPFALSFHVPALPLATIPALKIKYEGIAQQWREMAEQRKPSAMRDARRSNYPQQFWQLGDIHRDPPCLIAGQ